MSRRPTNRYPTPLAPCPAPQTLTYDAEHRLTTVTAGSTTASYTYNGLGERVTKTVNGVTTSSLLDGPEVVLEQTGATTTFSLHGPGLDERLARTTGSTTHYYHQDGLGSIIAITDASGALVSTYTYEPFGAIRSQTGTLVNPWTFTGRPLDPESGLYFLRNRYYDNRTGTFLTQDPIGIAGGMNLYAYVGNSPVNFTDPFGWLTKSAGRGGTVPNPTTAGLVNQIVIAGGIGFVVGGVVGRFPVLIIVGSGMVVIGVIQEIRGWVELPKVGREIAEKIAEVTGLNEHLRDIDELGAELDRMSGDSKANK